jgi:hypothetical protein
MPKRHKDRISISEDSDSFMSHCKKERDRDRDRERDRERERGIEREQHIEMKQDGDLDRKKVSCMSLHHTLNFAPHT